MYLLAIISHIFHEIQLNFNMYIPITLDTNRLLYKNSPSKINRAHDIYLLMAAERRPRTKVSACFKLMMLLNCLTRSFDQIV